MSHASPVASVAYDADAALNKEVREAMATTTLGAFLEERGTAAQPVTLASDDFIFNGSQIGVVNASADKGVRAFGNDTIERFQSFAGALPNDFNMLALFAFDRANDFICLHSFDLLIVNVY